VIETNKGAALDQIDMAILTLLREDARRTVTDIATRVNLSLAPVKRRIDRLEQSGVIRGYTVLVDPGVLRPVIRVFCSIRLAADASEDVLAWLLESFGEIDEVSAVSGDDDFLVQLHVETVERLQWLLNELRRHPRVMATRSLIVLRTWSSDDPAKS